MTAEVIVMNKRGVAIAADSAATLLSHGSAQKTISATKIQPISFNPPIALMHYNNSCFNNIEWSIICQSFKIAHPEPWKSVDQCTEAFLHFLAHLPFQEDHFCSDFVIECAAKISEIISEFQGDEAEDQEKIESWLKNEITTVSRKPPFAGTRDNPQWNNQSTLDFIESQFQCAFKLEIEDNAKWIPAARELLNQVIRHRCSYNEDDFSGIAIVGYGTEDFFPVAKHFEIFGIVGEALAYMPLGENRISIKNSLAVIPMAQTDVMESFLSGADPSITKTIGNAISEAVPQYEAIIQESINDVLNSHPEISNEIRNEIREAIENNSNGIKCHVSELYDDTRGANKARINNTVKFLSLPGLAKFAQGLIDITSLKRYMEQYDVGTVGRDTDVAILAKTDGFVWVKRKSLFDSEINQDFFGQVK